MCRLLGIVCNIAVDFEFTLPHFARLSDSNPDAWGIAWYTNEAAVVKTGKGKLATSPELRELMVRVRSQILISHVRYATSEPLDERGAHPFKDHALGRDWIFAHNGSIDRAWLAPRLKKAPSLGPDSRFYFRYLIEEIEENAGKPAEETLAKCLPELKNHTTSALNFVMSNGAKLYAFCGFKDSPANERRYTLQLTRRPRIEPRQLPKSSSGYRQMLYAKLAKGERAILVCSEDVTKLEGEVWEPLQNGKLVAIKRDNLRVQEFTVW